MKKRILSMLLVIVMVLSLVPVTALADEGTLKIEPEYLNVIAGDPAVQLSAKKDGTSYTDLVWATNPEGSDIATVSGDGKLTGLKQGSITVTATYSSDVWGTKTYKVYQPPVDLKLVKEGTAEAPAATMKVGDSVQLGYTCSNISEILPDYIITGWSIRKADDVTTESTEGILEVTSTGMLTAKKAGKATVRLAMNGRSVTQTIEVLPADPGEITIEKSASTMLKGKSVTLSVSMADRSDLKGDSYTWSVDAENSEGDVSFAESTTDNTCVVTGTKAGSVKIDVKRQMNGKWYEGSVTLSVESNDVTIKTADDKTSILVGEELQFTAYDANGQALEGVGWNSRDEGIAKFDPARPNTLIGVSEGSAKIYAVKGGYAVTEVTITVGANNINIVKADDAENKPLTGPISIYVGHPLKLKAVDKTGKELSVSWYNADANTNVTVVDGNLTGVTPTAGDTTVKIKAVNRAYGSDAFLDVKVLPKNTFIKLRLDNPDVRPTDLAVGETRQLVALKDTTSGPVEGVTWEITGGTGKAELVGENKDQLFGVADGTVELTATCYGFETKTETFHVSTELLQSVSIPGFPTEMIEGQEIELSEILESATFTPTYATDKTIDFTSCNKEDATKNDIVAIENGKLVAKKFGTAIVIGAYRGTQDSEPLAFEVKVKAANGIVVDPDMPLELVCGGTLDLKAVLKNAAGETLETPVQWRLKEDANSKVIKNLVDLTGNKLTAYPQSTYDFTVKLEAFIEGNDKVEVAPVEIHVLPRATNIILMKDTEDISDKTIILDVTKAAGITIDAVIKPIDARQDVNWQVKDPDGICMSKSDGDYIQIKPLSSQKTGTITVVATTADGTDISRETRIEFAKMADSVVITNAPSIMKGGANVQLRTNLDEDKTLTERRVEWSIVNAAGDPINSQYASVRVDGRLDTKTVTERTDIYVKATLIANPDKSGIAQIRLCPAVNTIKITQAGKPEEITTKDIVDFAEGPVQLIYTAYPANHIGSEDTDPVGVFVWTSSNEKIATVDPDGLVTLHDAGIVRISCTAYDTDPETALKIASGEIRDDSKVMAIGYKTLEIVKAAGNVEIDGLEFEEIDGIRYGSLIGGKNAVMTATVTTEKGGPLAGNQKVTWSVEDAYGNPTKAATINSRGRLYAKTVKYGTEVVVYATSVEDKEVIGQFHVMIQPKVERTFAAFLEGEEEPINGTLYMNPKEDADIVGKWYTRIESDFSEAVDCTFNSSNPAVAKIGKYDGTLETLKKGSTTITVRATDPITNNVYTTKFTVKVIYTVNHVSITQPKSTSIRSGKSLDLKANVWADEAGTVKADNQAVTWEIFEKDEDGLYVETKAASISSGGRVTARAVTEDKTVFAVVTSRENGHSDEIELTIRPKYAYTITLYKDTDEDGNPVIPTKALPLEMGEVGNKVSDLRVNVYVAIDGEDGYLLEDYDHCGWKTSNKKVAGINIDGDLVYVGNGTAKVNAYIKDGKTTYTSNTVTISLVKLVTEMTVEKKHSGQELYSGKSLLMKATVNQDATNKAVKWSFEDIDDYKFASINERTGLIRAKKGLTVQKEITVKATSLDAEEPFAVADTKDVTIYPLMSKITIVDDDEAITKLEMTKEEEKVLKVDLVPVEANEKAIKWTSSRSSIVKIDPKTGEIEALKRGTATIKAAATDGSGKYTTIKVTVK